MSTFEEMFRWLPHMRFDGDRPNNLIVNPLRASTYVVQVKGVSWYVWDNGGEVGVERINFERPEFFPMTADGIDLDSGTLADRLVRTMQGEPIDYDFRMDFSLEDVR